MTDGRMTDDRMTNDTWFRAVQRTVHAAPLGYTGDKPWDCDRHARCTTTTHDSFRFLPRMGVTRFHSKAAVVGGGGVTTVPHSGQRSGVARRSEPQFRHIPASVRASNFCQGMQKKTAARPDSTTSNHSRTLTDQDISPVICRVGLCQEMPIARKYAGPSVPIIGRRGSTGRYCRFQRTAGKFSTGSPPPTNSRTPQFDCSHRW